MARMARAEVVDPAQVQIFHCMQRCVRRAFLCGSDPHTGRSFEHRRGWIRDRLEFLASVFAIDCLTYTVMNNHLHLVLRTRPDVVESWSDEQVARRWLRLYPRRRNHEGAPAEPNQAEINMIVNQKEVLAERRRRLSDLSWWMKCTSETIARRANLEDEVTGHFWEGRFRAQALLDEAAVLACAAYVDLNPVRAAIAESPEKSPFTGAKDRIDDLTRRSDHSPMNDHQWERSRCGQRSGWMSPIEIRETDDPLGCDVGSDAGHDAGNGKRRASEKGFLAVSLRAYLELLDWTGRQIRRGKCGSIPAHLKPILARIGLEGNGWCDVVNRFGRCFKRAAGSRERLRQEALRRGQRWLQSSGALG
jgi:REP element-mobilizing transposase RayT